MWDSKIIATKIRISDSLDDLKPKHIHLRLFDSDKSIGVGIDGKGNTVLVLPGQSDVLSFQTEFANYDPWSQFIVFETGKQLDGVSILRCDIDLHDEDTVEAAAAIFFGLLDLQEQFGKTGKAIWQLKGLFENRLKFELSDNTVTGLIGELLIIIASKIPSEVVKFWHSNIDDKFDFSGMNFRLEVKSTTGLCRNHHFSSHQILGNVQDKTFVVSALIVRVEHGKTVTNLLDLLKTKLTDQDFLKVKEIVNLTLGIPTELIPKYQIDLDTSLSSLRLYHGSDIPCPKLVAGVISMEWLANLDDIQTVVPFHEEFFEKLR